MVRNLQQRVDTGRIPARRAKRNRRSRPLTMTALIAVLGLMLGGQTLIASPQAIALPTEEPGDKAEQIDTLPEEEADEEEADSEPSPEDESKADPAEKASTPKDEAQELDQQVSVEPFGITAQSNTNLYPELAKYITVGIGSRHVDNANNMTVELSASYLGETNDRTANVALTHPDGRLHANEGRIYADQGVVTRDANVSHGIEDSSFYPASGGSGPLSSNGNGFVQDAAGMDALLLELAAMKQWVSGLPVDTTVSFSSLSGTTNVDDYDLNGDGIAVFLVGNPGQHYVFDEKNINISGSGNVLPIFLLNDGASFDFEGQGSYIRVRNGLADATPAGQIGALFVQLNSGSTDVVYEFKEARIDRVGFYDLTLDPNARHRIVLDDETRGCTQLVASIHHYEDSRITKCAFGGPPTPPATTAEIRVYVGTDRIAGREGDATPIEGVTLRLAPTQNGLSAWESYDWATCVSGADGWCVFEVPIKTSGSTDASAMMDDAKPWVVGVSAPTGWSLLELWTPEGSVDSEDYHRWFQIDQVLSAGDVIDSKSNSNFMRKRYNYGPLRSFGQWTTIRDNPIREQSCAVDVAFVVDLSSSISSSQLAQAKQAMDASVDALTGTGSRIALFNFDHESPATHVGADNHPDLLPVQTAAEADTVKDLYAGWGTAGATNWDSPLYEVADATPDYDLVVFLTDGDPNFAGTRGHTPFSIGNGAVGALEAAVFSANLVKSQGTRIVGFGVGIDTGLAKLNLMAISGPVEGQDLFISGDYEEAGQQMLSYLTTCAATVDVQKRVIDDGETVPSNATPAQLDAISSPAAGWEINAELETGDAFIPDTAASQLTDPDTGSVTIPIKFRTVVSNGSVTVTETQQDGFEIVPVGEKNLVCTDASGAPVAVTNAGTEQAPGATLAVAYDHEISCVIYNRAKSGEVTWQKVDEQLTHLGHSAWKIVGPAPVTTEILVEDCVKANAAACTGPDKDPRKGYFLVMNLAIGDYELVETRAPAGYQRDDTPRPFEIGVTGGASLEFDHGMIENRLMAVPGLPLTGGLGEQLFWIIALVLAAGAATGVILQRRLRRQEG